MPSRAPTAGLSRAWRRRQPGSSRRPRFRAALGLANMGCMETERSQAEIHDEHPTVSSMLLADVQQMEPEGWSRLVHVFGPIVYHWCRSSGIADSDAPDVVQEVFASVARGIPKFKREKPQGSFRSWLATITRNRVRDYFRRQARHQPASGGTEALEQLQQQAESLDTTICPESAERPIVRRVLEHVRAEFEQSTWDAFWMTAIEGKSAADVAQAVGVSVASVYQSKSRILRRLRQRLAEIPS